MDRRHRNSRRLIAVFAIIFAVFVAAPVADALTCGTEAIHVSSSTGAHDHDDGGGDVHGLCVHGHCHMSFANLDQPAPELVRFVETPRYVLPADSGRAAFAIDGPERPPRA